MDTEPIAFVLDHKEICIPEQVVFKTVFLLRNPLTLIDDLARANELFLLFLSTNNLDINEVKPANMNENEIEYSSPSYLVTLTHPMYLLLEQYRDEHPEVTGFVVSKTFAEKDQNNFLINLGTKARQMAKKKAQQQGLILGNILEMEEIKSEPQAWVVYPPLSARYNHFQQVLTGQYRLVFSVHERLT